MTARKSLRDVIKFEIDTFIAESPKDAQNVLIKSFNSQVDALEEKLEQQNSIMLGQQHIMEQQRQTVEQLLVAAAEQKASISAMQSVIETQQKALESNTEALSQLKSQFDEIKDIKHKEQTLYNTQQDVLQEYRGVFTETFMDNTKMRMMNQLKIVRIGETKSESALRSSAKMSHNILDIGRRVFWRLRINGFGFSSNYYFIGVVPGQCTDFSVVAYDGLREAYGIHGGRMGKNVFLGTGHEISDESYSKPFRNGEVVYVEYCDGNLVFKRDTDDELIYSLRLPNGKKAWYPAVSLKCGGDTCEIIKNNI